MKGFRIGKSIMIDLASTGFKCPYCGEVHDDSDEKVYKRIVKNKCGYTGQMCRKCRKLFYVTADYMGDMQSFTLKKEIKC